MDSPDYQVIEERIKDVQQLIRNGEMSIAEVVSTRAQLQAAIRLATYRIKSGLSGEQMPEKCPCEFDELMRIDGAHAASNFPDDEPQQDAEG